MRRRQLARSGFSLLELMIVILLMGILATLMVPNVNSGTQEQLQSAAQIVAADLAYGRGLSVINAGKYQFTFDVTNNRYNLQYSGTDPSFKTLPPTDFPSTLDTPTQHNVIFTELPRIGAAVSLIDIQAVTTPSNTRITTIEFGPLGSTTQTAESVVWLGAGVATGRRYISVHVNPVTGLATVGSFQGAAPPTAVTGSGS